MQQSNLYKLALYKLGIVKLDSKEDKTMKYLYNYTIKQLQNELDKRNLEKYGNYHIKKRN